MKTNISAIWAVCCFRLNPLLPQGSWITAISFGLINFGLGIGLGLLDHPGDKQTIIGIRCLDFGVELSLLTFLLFFKREERAWASFFSTLFKVNLIFLIGTAFLQVLLLQLPKNASFAELILAMLQISFMIWNLLVNGFIFQHYFRLSLLQGFMIAFTIAALTVVAIINAYPKVYTDTIARAQADAAKQVSEPSH